MQRQSSPPPAQLALDLQRESKDLPITLISPALLQALADLLLGALGEQVEELESRANASGADDELEDHA